MNLLEFFIFALYLSMILSGIVAVQYFQPGKQTPPVIEIEETEERFDEKEFEEPESDQEIPFDPSKEEFTMTENPMLRQRKEISMMEMVD